MEILLWVHSILYYTVLLWAAVSGRLSDPGPLCAGDSVTLTCNISGVTVLFWDYDSIQLFSITAARELPARITVSGVLFIALDTSSEAVFQIKFNASVEMSGNRVECRGGSESDFITLQVQSVVGKSIQFFQISVMIMSPM